jgi:hypothetical protein
MQRMRDLAAKTKEGTWTTKTKKQKIIEKKPTQFRAQVKKTHHERKPTNGCGFVRDMWPS